MLIDEGLSLPATPPLDREEARVVARFFLTFLRELPQPEWDVRAARFRAWGLACERRGLAGKGKTMQSLVWAANGDAEKLRALKAMR